MAEVIGVVSGVIGIFQFLQSLFPEPPAKAGDSSKLRIAVALNGGSDGPTDADGAIKTITLYNENREKIASGAGDGEIGSGSFQDITIDQSDNSGQQPTYVQLNAGNHALCIAYLTQVWPDGTQRGWLGDMGPACGQSNWAYSNIIVDDNGHKPACTWLDQDHSNGISAAAVQIHMQDFTNLSTDRSSNPDDYCHLPIMIFEYNMDETGLSDEFWNSKRAVMKPRSALTKRAAGLDASIIGSNDPTHSALKLCQSETSMSPDFVSFSEGIFCDMATKTPWPLCSTTVTDDCYHWDTHTLITGGGKKAMNYVDVLNWE